VIEDLPLLKAMKTKGSQTEVISQGVMEVEMQTEAVAGMMSRATQTFGLSSPQFVLVPKYLPYY